MKKVWAVLLAGLIAAVYIGCPGNRAPEIKGISPSTVNATDTVNITCEAEDFDNDPLEYNWTYPSEFTYISGKDSSTITLIAPSDTGTYNFTVEVKDGRGGRDEGTFTVTVNPPPQIPGVHLFDPINPTTFSLDLVWNRFTGPNFWKYEVYHSTSSGFDPFLLTPDATLEDRNDTTFTVSGLAKGTTYYFVVVVYNQAGTYGISNEVSGRTNQEAPSPPVLYEPIVIAPDSVTLMWSWPSSGLERFDRYEIFMSQHPNFTPDSSTKVGTIFDKDDTVFTKREISRGTNPYHFKVLAFIKGEEYGTSNEVSANPTVIHEQDIPGRPLSIDLSQTFAYIAAREGGIVSISIAGDIPTYVWDTTFAAYALDVDIVGNILHVAFDGAGVYFFQMSGGRGTLVGQNDSIPALSVWGTAHYSYVGGGRFLRIVDVSAPGFNKPVVGAVLLPDQANDIWVSGDYAYIACANAGLQIVDISNPADPRLAGNLPLIGTANRVCVSGNYAYIAAQDGGLVIANVSDPSNPTQIKQIQEFKFLGIPITAYDVYVNLPYVYVATGDNGLMKIDVSDPVDPKPLTLYVWPDVEAQAVRTTSTHAYVGDYNHKFRSVKW